MLHAVHRFRLGMLAGVFVALLAAGRAADETKKPADDSITANRKELEALRADRLFTPAPEKLGLTSGMDMSALPSVAAPSAPVPMAKPEAKDPLKTSVKSEGWLLDGMEKERNRNTSTREMERYGKLGETDSRDRKESENLRSNSKDRLETNDDRSKAREGEPDRFRDWKPGEKATNPLTGYMATWMTPGDFSLLQKPSAINGSTFLTPSPDFGSPGPAGPTSAPSGGVATTAGLAPAPSARVENPYLRSVAGPAPVAGGGVMEMAPRQMGELAPSPSALPGMLAPPAPERARANPLVPENLKPSDDSKYFPQLKRF